MEINYAIITQLLITLSIIFFPGLNEGFKSKQKEI